MMTIELKREDFINQYPPLNLLNKKDVDKLEKEKPYNMYIHIPFCGSRCEFCYYKTFSLHSYTRGIPNDYFETLLNEIKNGIEAYALKERECHSIYVGGGTPTLMSPMQMMQLLECLKKYIKMSDDSEICFEARPGLELTEDKLSLMRDYNVTRISMGCQSLNDQVLKMNGRTHNSSMFYNMYEKVRNYEFPVINIDLMSGLCGDSEESFLTTLKNLVELAPQNITIYKMELYLNSMLYRKAKENNYELMTNQQEANMVKKGYLYLLNRGYEFCDNFSFYLDKKYEHIHRVATWFGEDMIGFGLSAHSRKGYYLYQNESRLDKYIEKVNLQKLSIQRAYKFTPYEDMVREMIFAVKKSKYDLNIFREKFGIVADEIFSSQLNYLLDNKFIEISDNILYTTLDGMLFADDIVRVLYPEKQRKYELAHLRRN